MQDILDELNVVSVPTSFRISFLFGQQRFIFCTGAVLGRPCAW